MKEKLTSAIGKVGDLASNVTDAVSNRASRLSLEIQEMSNSLSETGIEAFESNVNRVFPKTSAPAYIVHHSNEPENYTVHFDLNDVLSHLKNGVLARPTIQLYSGRSDIDRDQLSERVMDEFEKEMNEHKERVAEIARASSREHRDTLDKSLGAITKNAAAIGIGGVVATLISGPFGILALLLLGTFDHASNMVKEVMSIPHRVVKAGIETVTEPYTERSLKVDDKNHRSTIHKAISNLELHIHAELMVLAGSYDNVAYPFRGPRVSGELPEALAEYIQKMGIGGKYR